MLWAPRGNRLDPLKSNALNSATAAPAFADVEEQYIPKMSRRYHRCAEAFAGTGSTWAKPEGVQ